MGFGGRALRTHEFNYSIFDKEALSLICALRHFRDFLKGHRFTIFTDNFSLSWLNNHKNNSERLARYYCELSGYEFDIKHISGAKNVIADFLSRREYPPEIEGGPPPHDKSSTASSNAGGAQLNPLDSSNECTSGGQTERPNDRNDSRGARNNPPDPVTTLTTSANSNDRENSNTNLIESGGTQTNLVDPPKLPTISTDVRVTNRPKNVSAESGGMQYHPPDPPELTCVNTNMGGTKRAKH